MRGARVLGRVVLYIALALLVVVSAGLAAPASAYSSLTLRYSISDGVVRVSSTFYNLTVDAKRGLAIASWSSGDARLEWGEGSGFSLDFCSSLGLGGRLLSDTPWTHTVLADSHDVVRIALAPAEDSCLSPLRLSITVSFYSWSPYVDVMVRVWNPGNETVELTGSRGSPSLAIRAPLSANATAQLALLDSGGLALYTQPGDYPRAGLQLAALLLSSGGTLRAIYGVADAVIGGYTLVSFEKREGVAEARLVMPRALMKPGDVAIYSFKIALSPRDPGVASLAGLAPALRVAEPRGLDSLLEVLPVREHLASVARSLEELREEIRRLEARIGELEALIDYWRNEAEIKDRALGELSERLERQNAVSLALLAIGGLLGLAGGALAYRARVEYAARRALARRR